MGTFLVGRSGWVELKKKEHMTIKMYILKCVMKLHILLHNLCYVKNTRPLRNVQGTSRQHLLHDDYEKKYLHHKSLYYTLLQNCVICIRSSIILSLCFYLKRLHLFNQKILFSILI